MRIHAAQSILLAALWAQPLAQVAPEQPFARFAGDWEREGFALHVEAFGDAYAHWRTGRLCGPGVPSPCDMRIGSYTSSGGEAIIAFDRSDATGAFGEVVSSNDVVGAPQHTAVTFVLESQGMATLSIGNASMTLCGPQFATEAAPEVRAAAPCGAYTTE